MSRFSERFARLAAREQTFLREQFLAPVTAGGTVTVRLDGVRMVLTVSPVEFAGFGVFSPQSMTEAKLVREATLCERRAYLDLFPTVRLIIVQRGKDRWRGIAAHTGDDRFRIRGSVPVALSESVAPFDTIVTRFDGERFWFDGPDRSVNPAFAATLRSALSAGTDPSEVHKSGLTPELKSAYEFLHAQTERGRLRSNQDRNRTRIAEALGHGGASLVDFQERGDGYLVEYRIGSDVFRSAVDRNNLSVRSAGICLAGQDEQFDLTSLVGVIRAAGDGLYRMDYFDA